MVAIFGTMAADGLHVQLGIPYIASTIFFAIVLALIFIVWSKTEKSLSIHSINNYRREFFYWATVLATFALGTAAGDLTASTLGLGYATSILLFSGLILIPIIGYKFFKMNEVLAFWFAYIITRPIGASIADWVTKPKTVGGLGINGALVSIGLAILIIIFVIYMSYDKTEIKLENA
jgi:uncharacterized membrane-anchored protein